jgi:hypothetical protein
VSDYREPGEHRPRRHPPSLFGPLVFVGAGIILLLSNLGYVPWQSWNILWRLWPLLLVALGVDLLIGRRSVLGAIVSGLVLLLLIGLVVALVVFAQNIPALAEMARAPELHTEHVEYPLEGVESALVSLDFSAAPCFVSTLEDSPNLIEADVTLRNELVFETGVRGSQADVRLDSRFAGMWFWPFDLEGNERWDVRLSPRVPLELLLDTGSGGCDFDLTDLQIDVLDLNSGSGAVELTLPSASTFRAHVDSGSGSVSIVVPEGVGARVELDSGSGSFRPDGRFRLIEGERDDDGVWETQNFDNAEHTITLEIDQGSGSIRIEE